MWSGASNPWAGGGSNALASVAPNFFVRSTPATSGCDCVAAYLNTGNHFGECTTGDPTVACVDDGSGYCQCLYLCQDTGESGKYLFTPGSVGCPEAPPGFGQLPPGAQSPWQEAGVVVFGGVAVCGGVVQNASNANIMAFGDFDGSPVQFAFVIAPGESSPSGVDVDFVMGTDGRTWKVGPNSATVKSGGAVDWKAGTACQLAWRSRHPVERAGKCDGMCEAPVGGHCEVNC